MTVDRERLETLAALSAAGAATEEERRELEAMVAEDPAAAEDFRGFEEAASSMALGLQPVAPPEGALQSIREAIHRKPEGGGERQEGAAEEVPAPDRPTDVISLDERRRRTSYAVAAVALAAAGVFGFMWSQARGEVRDARERLAAQLGERDRERAELERSYALELERREHDAEKARRELERLRARYQPVQSRGVELVTLRGASESGVAKVFVDPAGRRWLVLAYDLPRVPNKDYQLWFVPPEGKPVSAGLLEEGPDGVLGAAPEVPAGIEAAKPAISLEEEGGAEQPTDVKMIGDLI